MRPLLVLGPAQMVPLPAAGAGWISLRAATRGNDDEGKVYPKYFGLKEPSFSITPDPQYLFLSGQHREALAHLLYGAGDGGGFVLLTGEVGTGKTTVCRAFLEQLPDGVDIALVLNPAMTAAELLHAICDEFGVELPPGEPSVKSMLDQLNGFLLDAHARGRRPVLIIDEAQNLRPKVLEQIRLLTNLETAKHKLLQIFLIGQPELRALLASTDLRQLNQRITARYHLQPLTARETAAYVDHRIAVAGVERPLFTQAALKRVHRHSRGVPRLINLLCDRALLGAAVSRRMQVTPGIVDAAAREVIDRRDLTLRRRPGAAGAVGMAAAVLAALALGIWIGRGDLTRALPAQLAERLPPAWVGRVAATATEPSPAPADLTEPDAAALAAAEDAPPSAMVVVDERADTDASDAPAAPTDAIAVADMIADVGAAAGELAADAGAPPLSAGDESAAADPDAEQAETSAAALTDSAADAEPEAPPIARIATTRIAPAVPTLDAERLGDALVAENAVVDELLRLWQVETAPGVRQLDCAAVPAFALACERSEGRWSDLRLFDRPAALKLRLPGAKTGFVVISGIDEEHALLVRDGAAARMPIAVLDERWSGEYLFLWRMPPYGGRVIGATDPEDAIAWLRGRLALLPGSGLAVDPARWDADVAAAVRRFQGEYGLDIDGIAGPRTLIMLSNALADLDVPRLSQSEQLRAAQ
jgi:general secretion pathway protein A